MTSDPATAMKARLRADLTAALKTKQAGAISLLRTLLAALDNAEAPAVASMLGSMERGPSEIARRTLSAAEVRAVIAREIAGREEAAAALEARGEHARSAALRAEAALARSYG